LEAHYDDAHHYYTAAQALLPVRPPFLPSSLPLSVFLSSLSFFFYFLFLFFIKAVESLVLTLPPSPSLSPSFPPLLACSQAEIKRDAQYAFLEVECKKGMALIKEKQQKREGRGEEGREGGWVRTEAGRGGGKGGEGGRWWWKGGGGQGRFLL